MLRDRVPLLLVGTFFGVVLSRVGFSRWDEVHGMFTFSDLRLLLAFMTAVVVLVVAVQVMRRVAHGKISTPARPVHPGSVAGGVVFGVGWALTGACPSIAMVQLGEGQLAALLTLGGIFVGNYLYSIVHERYFRWDQGNCTEP